MFSHRIPWEITPNPLSMLLAEKRVASVPIIDMTVSNPTEVGIEYPYELIASTLASKEILSYVPNPRGLLNARIAVSEYYKTLGLAVDPDSIHLTASTSEAYAFLFKLLADPGDEILVPRPSYPLFEVIGELENIALCYYNMRYSQDTGWRIDFLSLDAALTARTRAIVIVNPNNPTGSYVSKQNLESLDRICMEHNLALISDEVFYDFRLNTDCDPTSLLSYTGNSLAFTLSGFSKVLGLPQMKLAWIITRGPMKYVVDTRERLDLISDTFLSVNTPVQTGASKLFSMRKEIQQQIIERCRRNYGILVNALTEAEDVELYHADGGWNAIVRFNKPFSEEKVVISLLKNENVLVHPGYFFDLKGGNHLVFSLLTIPEKFESGIRRLRSCLAAYFE